MKSQPQSKAFTILTAAAFTALIGCSHLLEIKSVQVVQDVAYIPGEKMLQMGVKAPNIALRVAFEPLMMQLD